MYITYILSLTALPLSIDEIFRNVGEGETRLTQQRMQRAVTRSAENGTLKQDYPDTWHDTRYARNKCKKAVGTSECRDRGLCGEEDELEDLAVD